MYIQKLKLAWLRESTYKLLCIPLLLKFLHNRKSHQAVLCINEIMKTQRKSCWVNEFQCTRGKISSVKIRKKKSKCAREPPVKCIATQKYYLTGENKLVSEKGKINTHAGLSITLLRLQAVWHPYPMLDWAPSGSQIQACYFFKTPNSV